MLPKQLTDLTATLNLKARQAERKQQEALEERLREEAAQAQVAEAEEQQEREERERLERLERLELEAREAQRLREDPLVWRHRVWQNLYNG